MRARDVELSKGYGQFVHTLEVPTEGGKIAGDARGKLEKELGRSVISKKNYIGGGDKIKKLKLADNEKK